tara:strand:- start:353 stop:1003 length:651 start_codon:yes stop_codon:yes gene_type:complete
MEGMIHNPHIRIFFMGGPNPMNILEQSFQEDIPADTPVSDDFKETLEGNEVIQDESIIKSELSCAICQEPFIKGETVIKLPCEGQEHYFHKGDDPEKCAGIMPWLEVNNKCPICRTVFPEKENIKKEEDEHNDDGGNNDDANDEANNSEGNNDEENNDEEEQQVPHGFVINIPMGINSDNIGEQVQPLLDEMMDNIFEQKYEEDLQKILMQSFEDS